MNNTFEELAKVIYSKNDILIFPHVNPDGDAIGSTTALCEALRQLGKNSYVLIDEDIPENLKFMNEKGYCTDNKQVISKPDLCICVDCSDVDRFALRKDVFDKADTNMCLDHHLKDDPVFDYNYIDPDEPAACQIIYKLIKALNVKFNKIIGQSLYTGIMTDTGSFQYSNTNKESFEIAADLIDCGVDVYKSAQEFYERNRLEKIHAESMVMSTMQTYKNNTIIAAYASQEMLEKTGATMDEIENTVSLLRTIDTCKISILFKEYKTNEIKVSMRAKGETNVSDIAKHFNGGGHEKAAGCTINDSLENAIKTVMDYILKIND